MWCRTAHPRLQISAWHEIWNYSPKNYKAVIDVVRLLCGSLTVNVDCLGNTQWRSQGWIVKSCFSERRSREAFAFKGGLGAPPKNFEI